MTASETYEEIESLSPEVHVQQGSPSLTEEIFEEELELWEQQQEEAAPLQELEEREESPSPKETTTPGDRYVPGTSSSSAEFSLHPSVRQSMLLTRKETMLQQARKRFLDREASNRNDSGQ
ncbi:hypothetical protein OS493_005316 [Desmophyllum pertusum]|uniref:E3 ubiquitin-protein ligase AMFR Ube2g2-binding region domain-containing protein n=1 Tax=Desmophyllum pertusum TaxID=174260 RepID=A0A9W9Z4B9_9CNID|nr:hypothetical protein OS493_005316 [Desmophyllum pertusum]